MSFTQNSSLKNHYDKCPQKQVADTKKKYRDKLEDVQKELKKSKRQHRKLKIEIETTREDFKIKIKDLKIKVDVLEQENKELKEKLDTQKGMVEGMQKAPPRTVKNTAYIHPKLINLPINNIQPLTLGFVDDKISDGILTYEKAVRGYPGMLDVICDLITHENDNGEIEKNYVCTDVSRNSFHRLLESREWKADKGGRYLNNMLERFADILTEYKDKAYDAYQKTSHDSFDWETINWERQNVGKLYSGVVCREGTEDREELVNVLRKEIGKRASV
uniref:Uncharacterized protein n=1 Tax=Marseillevirus LCMAC101 TaxID=2506602 RepID=A0A481YTE1_9VIRU|nr:MAG: hypothetical protein LCMAC101_03690 [Marseillevirus LCMAC101]